MPLVNITYVVENFGDDAVARKTAIAGKVSRVIAEEMNVKQTAVTVIFEDVTSEDWFVGPDSVATRRRNDT